MPDQFGRRVVLMLLTGAVAAPARAADDASPGVTDADQQAIRDTIERQLHAFQAGDAASAFADASPGIQAMFGDAANFMAMVQRGYPPVYHPRRYAFGPLAVEGGKPVQKLELIGPDGARALALYSMQRQPDGSWKIDGCQLTESDSLGV